MKTPRERTDPRTVLSRPMLQIKALIAFAILSIGFSSAAQAQEQARLGPPADTVLLFVAAWCAPCLAELARFEELEQAARPRRLLIVSLDESARGLELTRRFSARQKLAGSEREGWDLLRRTTAGKGVGLPYAVMTDHAGAVCALRNRGLVDAELRAMASACGQ